MFHLDIYSKHNADLLHLYTVCKSVKFLEKFYMGSFGRSKNYVSIKER